MSDFHDRDVVVDPRTVIDFTYGGFRWATESELVLSGSVYVDATGDGKMSAVKADGFDVEDEEWVVNK